MVSKVRQRKKIPFSQNLSLGRMMNDVVSLVCKPLLCWTYGAYSGNLFGHRDPLEYLESLLQRMMGLKAL